MIIKNGSAYRIIDNGTKHSMVNSVAIRKDYNTRRQFSDSLLHSDRKFPETIRKTKYEVSVHTKHKHNKFINQWHPKIFNIKKFRISLFLTK